MVRGLARGSARGRGAAARSGRTATGRGCTERPGDGFAQEITGTLAGEPLSLRVSARFGGAVESIRWRGREFLNIYDHGRQISYAWHLDGWGECLNPTEPGSAWDNFRQSSTTELLEVCSDAPGRLSTRARPAWWLRPGETGFCDRGAETALNDGPLTDQLFEKTVEIGYAGIEGVIAFDATITLMSDHASLQAEMPTGYLTGAFTAHHTYDPQSGRLERPASQPLVPPWTSVHWSGLPPILATEDGQFAMGAYTDAPILGYEMLAYDVPNPFDHTNKWNMILRHEPAPAGTYRHRSFVIVGTLESVQAAMSRLYRLHPTDFDPPEGYVDVADCEQIAGWAWDPKAPDTPMQIEIYDVTDSARRLVHDGPADRLRLDLVPVLDDDGRHGYRIWTYQAIDRAGPRRLSVEVRNSVDGLPNTVLSSGDLTLECQ
ncbi:hypothetical protein [Roseisalinus antarcticus]|uniref:Uncharacterized protein n=1 Tax=Roseisalinus antarcticus TaxID=254357 RepID=A0A1Y5SRX7_9RHOB|nr:hypothetical protein [Roseisalinus antarcticus]SLN43847.1 hypothetical protein ROA7023_01803 [Roseisalinus antarcticus]